MTASERTRLLPRAAAYGRGSTPVSPHTPQGSTPPSPTTPNTPGAMAYGTEGPVPTRQLGLTPAAGAAPPRGILKRSAPLKETMSRARLIIILAGIWSSNFAFAFQSTGIPTLALTISSDFEHAELAAYLGSVFTMGNTAGIPVYGVLIDTLGRRFAMITACTIFGAGCAACALAPDMWFLIAGRALAGLGGGGLLTVSAVICTDLVHLRERGFYQGIMMTVFGAGSAIGGTFSGWLADTYGWRLSFWVEVPIVAFCALVVFTFLPEPPIAPTHASALKGLASLDWGGSALLMGSVAALVLGLSFHTSYFRPWSDPVVWGLLAASVAGTALFVANEARVKRPIVPLNLFRSVSLVSIFFSSTTLSIAAQAFLFHVPMYFSVLMDMSGAQSGWVLSSCAGVGLSLGSLFAGHHIRRSGQYKLVGVISTIPTVLSPFVAAAWRTSWPNWTYYATVLPTNIGYAIFLNATLIALISSVDSHAMPKATALLYTVRSLGSTLGVSLGGSIQVGVLVRALQQRFAQVPDGDAIVNAVVHNKAAIRQLPPHLAALALDAYAQSLRAVWIAAGVVAVATMLSSFGIKQNHIQPTDKPKDKHRRVAPVVDE